MFKIFKLLAIVCLLGGLTLAPAVSQADTKETLASVLKKVDDVVCSKPKELAGLYTSDITIISDDRRILLEGRIKDYEAMIAELEEMKCHNKRTLLTGNVGDKVGFLLVDEMISVSSRMSSDERQHSVCTYGFIKAGGSWKINHEHCSSLPDYTIVPGDDALYYFHNPVY